MISLVSILLSLYFFSSCLFLAHTHCIFYCLLLVVSCCISALIVYLVLGFSWYSLLLCLVYIGGVYVLFVFVSVRTPNSTPTTYSSWWGVLVCMWGSIVSLISTSSIKLSEIEASHSLCNLAEGNTYICLCATLLFGFMVISATMSVNPGFYR
nr:NADH dehydrogenase subunit 6 [Caryophyllaeus brachycollis]